MAYDGQSMSLTVLIVDNDADVQSLLAEVARRTGCVVRTADDGVAAQAELDREADGIDVLVCDLDMPRMTGGQLLTWLDASPNPPATLVVSGFVDEPARARLAERSWVRAVLRKPFDVMEFLGLLRDLVAELGGIDPAAGEAAQGA